MLNFERKIPQLGIYQTGNTIQRILKYLLHVRVIKKKSIDTVWNLKNISINQHVLSTLNNRSDGQKFVNYYTGKLDFELELLKMFKLRELNYCIQSLVCWSLLGEKRGESYLSFTHQTRQILYYSPVRLLT